MWYAVAFEYHDTTLHSPGNQFGKEGIETITQLLEGLGREELIGSFSEDEGDEDEDDDGDEEEDEEEEEGEEEEEDEEKEIRSKEGQEDVSAQNEKLQVKETCLSHEEQSSHRTEKVYSSVGDVVGGTHAVNYSQQFCLS